MELSLFQSIFRDILYNGQEWKRFSTKVPVLYIFVPLAMIEIVNRRWGAWQSGFMGSSPLSPPLPYNTIDLQCSKTLSEYFNTSSNGTEVVWRSGKVLEQSTIAMHGIPLHA